MFNLKKQLEIDKQQKKLKSINSDISNSKLISIEIRANLPQNNHKFVNYSGNIFSFDDYFAMGYVSEGAAYEPKFICGSLIPKISGELSISISDDELYKFSFSQTPGTENESKCKGDIYQIYGLGDLKIGTCEVLFDSQGLTNKNTERSAALTTLGNAAYKYFDDSSSSFASDYFKNISAISHFSRCKLLDSIFAQGVEDHLHEMNQRFKGSSDTPASEENQNQPK